MVSGCLHWCRGRRRPLSTTDIGLRYRSASGRGRRLLRSRGRHFGDDTRSPWALQMRPRTSTPARARPASSSPIDGPSGSIRSSASPRQSVNHTRSPARRAISSSCSREKYVAPWISGRTRFPSDQDADPAGPACTSVAGFPRSARLRNHAAGSVSTRRTYCEGTIAAAAVMTPTDNGVQLNVSSLSDRYPAGLPP